VTETHVLRKGLGFALAPRRMDVVDFAASVEMSLNVVNASDRAWIRREVVGMLKSFKLKGDNLTVEERKALNSLRSMDDVVFLPADKGTCTVILNSSSYDSKLEALIQEGPYRMVKGDPGQRFRKQLTALLSPLVDRGVLDRGTYLRWCPTHFVSPHIYGLPKVHKEGCPLRPIVSMRGSLFSSISGYLARILAPYYQHAPSHVENSLQVKRRVSEALRLNPTAILGSFDVVSLFTQVPVREAIDVVVRLLNEDSDLASRTQIDLKTLGDLIEFCLTSCYFLFRSTFYVQEDGVAMGSSLGCVVANVYMCFFEDMALSTALRRDLPTPLIWIRYVDDILAMFGNECDFSAFISFLNSLRVSIQFTVELESQGQLPFLDLHIKRVEDTVVYGVYRKPTHTDLYLNRDSCHPPQVFRGLVTGLKKRALSLCSGSEAGRELRHIRHVLSKNGYSQKDLSLLNSTKVSSRGSQASSKRIILPYIPGLSNRISRCFKKTGLSVGFRPPTTLRSILVKKKPRQIEGHGSVYRISCSMCSWSYVGETGRTIKQRVSEHRRAVRNWSTSSEIANHVAETGHAMKWDEVECLAREPSHFRRIFKESWFSKVHSSGNRVFHELDAAWIELSSS
jgi:hypothetical protein